MKFLRVIDHWPTKAGLLWSPGGGVGLWGELLAEVEAGCFVRSGPADP